MNKVMTICFLIKENTICLAEKKRGFRVGKLNGYGGKLEEGETIEECAIRETQEEACVIPRDLVKCAEVSFQDTTNTFVCHVYTVKTWEGNPIETDEMNPFWYSIDAIPFERMGEADALWIPLVLQGNKILATFYYDINSTMCKTDIKTVDSF